LKNELQRVKENGKSISQPEKIKVVYNRIEQAKLEQ
jgi:hypothetical protein